MGSHNFNWHRFAFVRLMKLLTWLSHRTIRCEALMAAICSVGCRKAQIRLVCTIAHHFRIGSGCKKKGSVLVRLGCQYSSSKSRELAHWTSDDPRPAWSFWSGSMKRWRWKMIWQDPQRRAMSQIGVMRWEINAIIKKLESHCECVQDEVAWEWQLGVDGIRLKHLNRNLSQGKWIKERRPLM